MNGNPLAVYFGFARKRVIFLSQFKYLHGQHKIRSQATCCPRASGWAALVWNNFCREIKFFSELKYVVFRLHTLNRNKAKAVNFP